MQHTFVSAHISLEMVETLGIFCLLLLMAEIRRSPVEVGSSSHYLQGFIHPRWFSRRISAINSRSRWSDGKGTRWSPNPPKIRCIGAMFDPYP